MVTAKELKAVRLRARLTTEQMARLGDRALSTYTAYEQGELSIPNDVFERIVEGIQELEADGKLLEASGDWIRLSEVMRILGVGRSRVYQLVETYGVDTQYKSSRVMLFRKSQIDVIKTEIEHNSSLKVSDVMQRLGIGRSTVTRLIKLGILVPLDKPGPQSFNISNVDDIKKLMDGERDLLKPAEVIKQLGEDGIVVDRRMLFYYLKNQSQIGPLKSFTGDTCYPAKSYEAIKKLVVNRINR